MILLPKRSPKGIHPLLNGNVKGVTLILAISNLYEISLTPLKRQLKVVPLMLTAILIISCLVVLRNVIHPYYGVKMKSGGKLASCSSGRLRALSI